MGDITSDLNYVVNKTTTPTQPLPGPQEALVISADPAAGVKVKIPSYHPDWAFGPAKFTWPGPGPLPPVNTACLVEFVGVDLTNPWIVAWATVSGGTPSIAGQPLAAPGATAPSRYMGGTATGPPTSGAFLVGDYVIAADGNEFVCTAAGTPGTWAGIRGLPLSPTGGITGVAAAARFVGGTAAGAPTAGTFAVGDMVVDQTGVLWICRTAGTPGVWRSSQDRPTGDIEPTLLAVPKPNTLILNGQTVSRTTYAALWAFAQANSLVKTGLFTAGNGTTTFGVPDFRGLLLRGVAATGEAIGALVGADSLTLSLAQLPVHGHSVSVNDDTHSHGSTGGHTHGGSTSSDGGHDGHEAFPITVAAGSGATNVMVENSNRGTHSHGFGTDNQGVHSHPNDTHNHTVTQSNVGSGSTIDNRQASVGVNYLIWV